MPSDKASDKGKEKGKDKDKGKGGASAEITARLDALEARIFALEGGQGAVQDPMM